MRAVAVAGPIVASLLLMAGLAGCAGRPLARPAPAATAPATVADGAHGGAMPATATHGGVAPHADARVRPARASVARTPSPLVVPLDAATLAALPREALPPDPRDGPGRCEGVALHVLLRAAGALPGGSGGDLDRYVLVAASDGGRALFSLAELLPAHGATGVFVADRCDGAPLPAGAGPLRLSIPATPRSARALRGVVAITVVAAP